MRTGNTSRATTAVLHLPPAGRPVCNAGGEAATDPAAACGGRAGGGVYGDRLSLTRCRREALGGSSRGRS